eukprot:306854-Amphidinium_carterae.1
MMCVCVNDLYLQARVSFGLKLKGRPCRSIPQVGTMAWVKVASNRLVLRHAYPFDDHNKKTVTKKKIASKEAGDWGQANACLGKYFSSLRQLAPCVYKQITWLPEKSKLNLIASKGHQLAVGFSHSDSRACFEFKLPCTTGRLVAVIGSDHGTSSVLEVSVYKLGPFQINCDLCGRYILDRQGTEPFYYCRR